MHLISIKYRQRCILRRTAILLTCCFYILFAAGQDPDAGVVDSAIIEAPPTYIAEKSPYFFQKDMIGAGMDSVYVRRLPDSLLRTLKQSEDFQYGTKTYSPVTNEPERESPTPGYVEQSTRRQRVSEQTWFQSLLWILSIGGFAAFIVLWLAGSNVRLFRRKTKRFDEGTEEGDGENIFQINYQREIDKAAAAGNYRLAIRLMFLRLLKTMTEKNVIRYKHDSTNLDYLRQLNATDYYNDFFRIARNYEYSWYGQFDIREETFKIIRNDFDQFDRKLS